MPFAYGWSGLDPARKGGQRWFTHHTMPKGLSQGQIEAGVVLLRRGTTPAQ